MQFGIICYFENDATPSLEVWVIFIKSLGLLSYKYHKRQTTCFAMLCRFHVDTDTRSQHNNQNNQNAYSTPKTVFQYLYSIAIKLETHTKRILHADYPIIIPRGWSLKILCPCACYNRIRIIILTPVCTPHYVVNKVNVCFTGTKRRRNKSSRRRRNN